MSKSKTKTKAKSAKGGRVTKAKIASVTRKKPYTSLQDRMFDLIAMHGPTNRSKIMQRLSQFPREEREQALSRLVTSRKVSAEQVETGRRGRPAEVLSLAG